MYKVILTYTVNGSVKMKRKLANAASLPNVMMQMAQWMVAYEKNGITVNSCDITPCTVQEVTQIGADIMPEIVAILQQYTEVLAVTRDKCPLFVKDVESVVTLYVSDCSERVLRLKKELFNYYNTLPATKGNWTDIQIKYNEDPDLTIEHMIQGVDY